LLRLLWGVLVLTCTCAYAQRDCTWNGYDLSALAGSDYPGSDTSYQYKLNICGTVVGDTNCASKGAALCQYTFSPPSLLHVLNLWDNTGQWAHIDANDPTAGVQVVFNNGDSCPSGGTTVPRQVTYQFPCVPGSKTTTYKLGYLGCNYIVNFPTGASCTGGIVPSSGGGGLSGGSIFSIIFFVVGLVYVVAGCIFKRVQKGASGMDACPNIDVWREIPGLVGDGARFTWTKLRACCGGAGAGGAGGGESYNTIK